MLAEAAGLAVLAAISPTVLLLAAVYLGSARPRETILAYLAGALLMSVAMGVVVLVVLRAGGLSLPAHRTERYGLRLALGIVLLLSGLVVLRLPKPPDRGRPKSGLVPRLMASPAPYTAFLAGLLLFAPGVTFIAAVQVVATANADLSLTAVGLSIVVVINVALVWLPLLAFLIAPEPTARRLAAFNGWLRRNSRTILSVVLVAAGIVLVIDGATGLFRKG